MKLRPFFPLSQSQTHRTHQLLRTMVITVDIPHTPISELRAWYDPRDAFPPVGDRKVSPPGLCQTSSQRRLPDDPVRCLKSQLAYKESYHSLRSFKNLRRMVAEIAQVDEGVAKMEKEILPLSCCHGIWSLPGDTIVDIISLVWRSAGYGPYAFRQDDADVP